MRSRLKSNPIYIVILLGILFSQLSTVFGQTLYSATGYDTGEGQLFTVDPATGDATLIGDIIDENGPIGVTGMAFHPITQVLYAVTGDFSANDPNSLVTIDTATGDATFIGDFGTVPILDISFDSNGVLYGWLRGSINKLATLDITTGEATEVGPVGSGTAGEGGGLTFIPDGTLYLALQSDFVSDGAIQIFEVDPVTGVLSTGPLLPPEFSFTRVSSMAADSSGVVYGTQRDFSLTTSLITIDPVTGDATGIGLLPDDTDALAFVGPLVALGIESAFSIARHGGAGDISIPLNLTGQPTSDPRARVNEIVVVFEVPVQPSEGDLTPDQVIITSSPVTTIPTYTVSFAEGGNVGQELTINFSEPLPDQHLYGISFENFVTEDGNPLGGDTDLEFRVLQGDSNNNGAVTATDVSFVRGRINQVAAPGAAARSDVNMSGSITGPDVSFVRSRIGNSAP